MKKGFKSLRTNKKKPSRHGKSGTIEIHYRVDRAYAAKIEKIYGYFMNDDGTPMGISGIFRRLAVIAARKGMG